jgi:hypothetical protein
MDWLGPLLQTHSKAKPIRIYENADKKNIRHILPGIVMGLSLFVAKARADDVEYDNFGGWFIVYVDAVRSNSCSGSTTFTDQTVLQLALVQTPSEVAWATFLSNAKWNAIFAARAQVTLSLLTSKSWSSTFSVTTSAAGDKAVLVCLVPTPFIKSIADAKALLIFDDKNRTPHRVVQYDRQRTSDNRS